MHDRDELTPGAHRREIAALGGSAESAFVELAGRCVRRWMRQNSRDPLPDAFLGEFLRRLWSVVVAEPQPRPLAEDEEGEPAEMAAGTVADLSARVFDGLAERARHAELDVPTRQLLKACLQPEFRKCRESYREVTDGSCRRQEPAKARTRISGTHCVDCPYWVAFRPAPHAGFLARAWHSGNPGEFECDREVFLPEDFRALRVFLWRRARAG